MRNKTDLIFCLILLMCLLVHWTIAEQLTVNRINNQVDQKINLTEKYNKCLRPLQKTEFSLDGLTNCTCQEGYEFDKVFGVCFKNKVRTEFSLISKEATSFKLKN